MLKNLLKIHKATLIVLCFLIPLIWWTRLNANYYSTKTALFYFTSAFALLGLSFNFSMPKLPRTLLISTCFILLFQVVFHTYRLDYADFLFSFKFLGFASLCFYFYNLKISLEEVFEKTSYLILISIVFILAVSLKEFYTFRIENVSLDFGLVSTFGNINMFAEFLVLSLPFVFAWSRYKDGIPSWIKTVLFTLWVFFIFYCRSRSAWIGFGLWLVLFYKYKVQKKELISIGFAFLCYLMAAYAPAKNNITEEIKNNNTVVRSALAYATLDLIKDHPWGIRPGGFMGEIAPYQMASSVKPSEFSYFDQPHSELLKWPAQFGWMFAAFVVLFLAIVIFIIGKWFFKSENYFLVGSFAVLIPQICFQFPYENPASLLYLSFVTALFYLSFPKLRDYQWYSAFRVFTVALAAAGIWNAYAFVNSVYVESTYPRKAGIIEACEYYPINIKACHGKLGYFIDNKQFSEFTKHFKVEFMRDPLFVDYLRLLPTYYSVKPDNKKTCQSLFLYRTIFPNSKTFDQKYYDNCKGFPDIFYFENPMQFRAQYMKWLDNLN